MPKHRVRALDSLACWEWSLVDTRHSTASKIDILVQTDEVIESKGWCFPKEYKTWVYSIRNAVHGPASHMRGSERPDGTHHVTDEDLVRIESELPGLMVSHFEATATDYANRYLDKTTGVVHEPTYTADKTRRIWTNDLRYNGVTAEQRTFLTDLGLASLVSPDRMAQPEVIAERNKRKDATAKKRNAAVAEKARAAKKAKEDAMKAAVRAGPVIS